MEHGKSTPGIGRGTRGRRALVAAFCAALTGCWSMTALNTGKTPPPPPTAERWQLTEQLEQLYGGNADISTFDDTGYYYANGTTRIYCPYAMTPEPVAIRRWFWNIFMPMPLDTRFTVNCAGGTTQNVSPGWDKEPLKQFAVTWYQLAHMPDSAAGLAEFGRRADAWRALPEKPAQPEALRAYKVAAEAAVRDKQWKDAVQQYRKALAVDPFWPQGHFNLALLYAELHRYESAGVEMQKYLLLAPDAANARQAQDKIYEWRAKLPAT